jgi:hypothetical protein
MDCDTGDYEPDINMDDFEGILKKKKSDVSHYITDIWQPNCQYCNLNIVNTTHTKHLRLFRCFENQGDLAKKYYQERASKKLEKNRAEKARAKEAKEKREQLIKEEEQKLKQLGII